MAMRTQTHTGIAGSCAGGGGIAGTAAVVRLKVADQSLGMFRLLTSIPTWPMPTATVAGH